VLAVLVGLVGSSTAQQLQLMLQMDPNPSPYLSDWQTRQETVLLSVTNPTPNTIPVRIAGRVHQGGPTGNILAQTKVPQMPVLQIPPGASIFSAEDVVPYDQIEFFGGVETDAVRTGRIPSGEYTLCVALVHPENFQPLTQPRCSQFFVQQHLPPQLLAPYGASQFTADQLRTQVMRWSRETPPVFNSTTELLVVELRQDQPLWQALSANPPVFQGEIPSGLTQMQWPPDVYLVPGRTYVWSVRVVDDKGNAATEPEWADPFVFNVIEGQGALGCAQCGNLVLERLLTSQQDGYSFAATTDCPENCVRELKWTASITSASGNVRDLTTVPVSYVEPFAGGQNNNTFTARTSESGTLLVTCTMVIGGQDPASSDPPRDIVQEISINIAGISSAGNEDVERSLQIVFPPNPCVGEVGTYQSDAILPVEWVTSGPFSDFEIIIIENPCGTYVPPPIDDLPIPREPNPRYPEITRTGPITPMGDRHKTNINIGNAVTPGAAYVVRVVGNFTSTSADGTSSAGSMSDETCERYRPLVPQTEVDKRTTSTPSGGSRETVPRETTPDDKTGDPRVPTVPVPVLDCPPPPLCGPTRTSEPATPIQGTLELENADLYKYPRAAPLRAITVDWDRAIFICEGCAPGTGLEKRPVRDLATKIEWKLTGKGALNVPFDVKAIAAIDDAIDSLIKRLADVKDSIALTEDEKKKAIEKFKDVQDDARTQLVDREKELDGAKDSLKTVISRLDSARKTIDSLGKKLDSLSKTYALLLDSASVAQDSIRKYDSLLADPLTSEEKTLLAEVATTKTALEAAEAALQAVQVAIATTSAALQDAIKAADKAVADALAIYKREQDKAGKDARSIADLQDRLYNNARLRAYRSSRRDLQRQFSTFMSMYPDAVGLTTMEAYVTSMLDDADDVLDDGTAAERRTIADKIDSIGTVIMAMLSTSCSAISDTARRSSCDAAGTTLSTSISRFVADAGATILASDVLKKSLVAKISAERAKIVAQEAAIAAAAGALTSATAAHAAALETFKTTMKALDDERKTKVTDAQTAQTAHSSKQREFLTAEERADSIFRELKPSRLASRAEHSRKRDSALRVIDSLTILVDAARRDSIRLLGIVNSLVGDSTKVKDSITVLEQEIARLKALLKLTEDDIAAPFDKRLAKLRSDSAALEAEIEAKKKERDVMISGNKSAESEVAYYIPPPLEEIIKNKKLFNDLRDSVDQAEIDLTLALEERESLQAKLVRLMEGISNDLARIKTMEFQVKGLDSALKAIDKELAKLKNDLTKDHREQYDDIDAVRSEAESNEKSHDAAMVDATKTAAERAKKLDAARDELDAASVAADAARLAVTKAAEDARERRKKLQASANVASEEGSALNTDKKEVRDALRDEVKAEDKTRRGVAKESLAQETIGRAESAAARAKQGAEESSAGAHLTTLSALSKTMGSDFKELAKEDTAVSKAVRDYAVAEASLKSKRLAYDVALSLFEAAQQSIEHWRGLRDAAARKKNEAQAALDAMPKADDVVKDDESVASKEAYEKEIDKQKSQLTKNIAGVKKTIEDAVTKKDDMISAAMKKVDEARDHLTAKEEELRSFLLDEFKAPLFEDTLDITVDDIVVDGFRANDEKITFQCIIKYDGKRTPELLCTPIVERAPPVEKQSGPCIPEISTEINGGISGSPPVKHKNEPRTIALVYKDGRPLWPEWPVITTPDVLAKDVIMVTGTGSDNDIFVHACVPLIQPCDVPPPQKPSVVDLVSRNWSGEGTFYHIRERSPFVFWEPDLVRKGICDTAQKIFADMYKAAEIMADAEIKVKGEIGVKPGVLIEVTDSLVGWPDKTDTVVARVVTGDHKGLAGEEVTVRVRLTEGRSENWDLGGSQDKVTKTTDGEGYVKIPFKYGDGFAKWTFDVRWHRPDTCMMESFSAISPLYLKFHRLGRSSPTVAWNGAVKVWKGASVDDALKSMPDVSDDEDPYGKMIHGVAGFINEDRDFVDDELMKFEPLKPKFTIDPTEERTSLFGIARTQVQDTIENDKISMKAFCEDTLKPVCRPPSEKKEYDPKGQNLFKIGSPDDLFVIEMEEPFGEGDIVTGPGKLKLDPNKVNEFMRALFELPITATDVEIEGTDDDAVAIRGKVEWDAGGLETKFGAFSFTLSSVWIRAKEGCGIAGTMAHDKIPDPVSFTAELGNSGQFYGEVSNLPAIDFAGFKLRQGASLACDFHSTLPKDSPFGSDFRGIVIGTAELEFPDAFKVKGSEQPTVLSVADLGIGYGGVTGTVTLSGGPVGMNFARFGVSVSSVSITLDKNDVVAGAIEGEFSLGKPFTGTVATKISYGGGTWTAEFNTVSSLSIPRWKAVAAIMKGTKLEWNKNTGIGTFTLVSLIQSDRFGEIEIRELTLKSDGTFKVDGGVKKDYDIKVISGFDLTISGVDIKASNDDFELVISGHFGIPGIGLKDVAGDVMIRPGPDIDVNITKGDVTISKGPFTLDGTFEWQDNAFYAKLAVEIKNVLKGIEGEILVGSQPLEAGGTYTFWYVGLTISTAIPLGQSGLAISSIGGGVGWNCRPPIGAEKPTPEHFNDITLRASVGIGNGPVGPAVGKLFNSVFTMVYVPGSITLAGEAWLLEQREALVGDGRLTVEWSPKTKVHGFVRARIAMPDNGGKVLLVRGKVNFEFSPTKFLIESEYMDASLLGVLNANAQFKVTPTAGFFKGKVWYELSGETGILVGTVKGHLALSADGELTYKTSPSISLTGSLSLSGKATLSFYNSLTSFDLASAYIHTTASVSTSGSTFKVAGTAKARVSVLGFSGDAEFDLKAEV
jgi:DNA repair exonuclease SbcCD ATPase subunit